MASSPLNRLETSMQAFTTFAVDFAGLFVTVQGRCKQREKWYLCVWHHEQSLRLPLAGFWLLPSTEWSTGEFYKQRN